jgi:hypothetical protein
MALFTMQILTLTKPILNHLHVQQWSRYAPQKLEIIETLRKRRWHSIKLKSGIDRTRSMVEMEEASSKS